MSASNIEVTTDREILTRAKASIEELGAVLAPSIARYEAGVVRVQSDRISAATWILIASVVVVFAAGLGSGLIGSIYVGSINVVAVALAISFLGILTSAFVAGVPWPYPRSNTKADRRLGVLVAGLVDAIRVAEATKEKGWLVRFSCFATGSSHAGFIHSFDAASEFDPWQYLEAIAELRSTLEEALKDAAAAGAVAFSIETWRAAGREAGPPPTGACDTVALRPCPRT
ncbi:hypothetical protein E4T66_18195 [Sinimarinibacterium sp. CAU 1509]|uniref:hypothetical protein n=1 Tax=Sinimarinibacterium sp. CAU 1509 TaxID=2562283 RepID=UPI0010ACC891|nr:hypothetical protein [Sinimarinibacterium sp. CAU 1509]TJY57337.1 hypothetical protein E4T66_18195 [Sinimarinibacterium sp. CAU 1509]